MLVIVNLVGNPINLRQRVAETLAAEAFGAEGKKSSLSKALDGHTFHLQVDDDSAVEDVYKHNSEKISLQSARKLLPTSGCSILDHSELLLTQAQNEEN